MKKLPLIVLSGLVYGNLACQNQGAPEKTNIIFILTDDHRWDALGFAGNNVIQTPEMDKLAKDGLFFRNAFVTTPICAASRASILNGMYERTHGYTFGQGEIKQPYINISYPALMKQSGYYTGFFGKFGVNYSQFDQLFDVGDNYDRNGKFNDRRGYFYKTIGNDTVHLTRYTGQQALDFINNVPDGRPFCLSLSFSAPHAHDSAPEQYFWGPEVDTLYQDYVFPPPVMGEDSFFYAQPPYVRDGLNRTRWYWRFDTPEKYQHSLKGYYRMITEVDNEIGKIRKLLNEKELDQNTVIILIGDNGYFLGERQLAGKWLMYEPSLRVPLIIYDPASRLPQVIDDMALNIDIAPTIFEYAGIEIPEEWQGLSLAGYSKGRVPASGRQSFLCEHLWQMPNIPPSEGIRTAQWKYFRYQNDLAHEELYNLENDPEERFNLATDPQFRQKLDALRLQTEITVAGLNAQKLEIRR